MCCEATSLWTGALPRICGMAYGQARVEAATRGRIERARDLAGDGQLLVSFVGVRRQGRGEQGLRIG